MTRLLRIWLLSMILPSGTSQMDASFNVLLTTLSSLIPYIYHAKVIAAAVKHKKNVVTTSYVSPAMMEYDQA